MTRPPPFARTSNPSPALFLKAGHRPTSRSLPLPHCRVGPTRPELCASPHGGCCGRRRRRGGPAGGLAPRRGRCFTPTRQGRPHGGVSTHLERNGTARHRSGLDFFICINCIVLKKGLLRTFLNWCTANVHDLFMPLGFIRKTASGRDHFENGTPRFHSAPSPPLSLSSFFATGSRALNLSFPRVADALLFCSQNR
jgi:hypothetical protein